MPPKGRGMYDPVDRFFPRTVGLCALMRGRKPGHYDFNAEPEWDARCAYTVILVRRPASSLILPFPRRSP